MNSKLHHNIKQKNELQNLSNNKKIVAIYRHFKYNTIN